MWMEYQVEQMLTTGGGWQDQVGGLLPGIKFSSSPSHLPLFVDFEVLDVPLSFIDVLNQHMICIYTGSSSLAPSSPTFLSHVNVLSQHPPHTQAAHDLPEVSCRTC
jgi:galactokinase/mevalonate kinase-like predicted kinase